VDPGAQLGASVKEVIFDFLNARIVSFDLDDLNHEVSEVNVMTMQFDYDWMEIVDAGSLSTMDGPAYNVTIPGVGGAPVDMTTYGKGASTNAGAGGAFSSIISNQLSRAAQSVTSSTINRAVKAIAGNGQFASAITSQASNVLGGIAGAASRNLANGLTQSVNQGSALAANSTVIDSAAGGPAQTSSVTYSGEA